MHLLHFSSYESDLVWHRGASLLYQDDNFQQQYERHSFPSKNLIKMNKFENLLHCVNFMFAQDFLNRAFKYQRIEKREELVVTEKIASTLEIKISSILKTLDDEQK